jgi:hypothetical protein
VSDNDTRERFNFDLRRTIILSRYIHHWGIPDYRVVSRKGSDVVEVYSFPPSSGSVVHRFATIGVSAHKKQTGEHLDYELLTVLPPGLGGASIKQVADFLLDVFAHGLRSDVHYRNGCIIPEITVMPDCWRTRAAMLDEPLGEPEELSVFHVGAQHVTLYWVIFLHQAEAAFISSHGLEEFDRLVKSTGTNLIDPNHNCCVSHAST